MDELKVALNQFAYNKSPGCDGMMIELYVHLWDTIAKPYFSAIQHAVANGKLHISARRGILTLIPKRERNPNFLKNWRPLTMLSVDYKIFAKALDNRLKTVLPEVIAKTQTGFMAQRHITSNIIKLMQLMSAANAKKTQMLVMIIDFEKCFDTISFSAISGSLWYFGVGEQFIKYVHILFQDFEICTQNNRYSSPWIHPHQGVHQGCPISPHLYNCCRQVFADLLETNSKINGITARGVYNLLSQFADNTSLFLHGDEENIAEVTRTLMKAQQNLGLKVNIEKTTIYRTGSLQGSAAKFYTQKCYAWSEPPIYMLGAFVSTDMLEMSRLNIQPLIEQCRSIMDTWQNRQLTLTGKVLIINTLIESKFVNQFDVTPFIQDELFTEIQSDIVKFIWKGKRPKITFDILSAPPGRGD